MISALGETFLRRPVAGVAALCLTQAVLWSILPAITSTSPTLDVAEILAWGEHWQLGYYKHPPLPAWLAEAARMASGDPVFGPLVASQLCIVLTFLFVFLLGRRLLGARDAFLGTALCTGVYYFSWPTPELNHNIVQMPIWAACFWALAVIQNDPKKINPWLGLGLVTGIGIYAKYSVVVLYAVLGAWILIAPRLRSALASPGPWLGAGLAIVIASPHLVWLVSTDFMPIVYAEARSSAAATSPWRWLGFLLAQLGDHAPLILPLGLALLPAIRLPTPRNDLESSKDAVRFLLIATLAPVFLTALGAAIAGAGIKDMWAAPMFTTSGLLAVALVRRRLDQRAALRLLAGCALLLAVLPVAYAAQVPIAARHGMKPPRNGWPMAAIARSMTTQWHNATGRPLRYVAGDTWLAALVAAGSPDRPSLVSRENPAWSPWASPADLDREGVLVITFAGDTNPWPEDETPTKQGDITIPWSDPRPLVLHYALYPPLPAAALQ